MKISRFVGANSRDVMRQVRLALGPDALIVSNRSVDGGVEVLATLDGAFEDSASDTPQRDMSSHAGASGAAAAAPSDSRPQGPAVSPYGAQPTAPYGAQPAAPYGAQSPAAYGAQ
ncbi:MAG TPA: flagellar biosynthesis protein FlhF, partial [Achromobacter sp.]|nr:flagellar biosynthesis protein FlhF [Achromobacter sp.]